VATLHSGELEAGSHTFGWDGTDGGSASPAGIYLARFSMPGGSTAVRRIVLLR
jgi:hypothetical protein